MNKYQRKESNMFESITRNWWIVLLRGIFAILFGVVAFVWPGITLLALVLVFGIYALVDGISAITFGLVGGAWGVRWWQMILVGIISVITGIFAFSWPIISAVALLMAIAAWSICRGIAEIVAAIELRKFIAHEWLLILGGVGSILFGIAVIALPNAGALAVLWIIGIYALIFGALTVTLALKLRSLNTKSTPNAAALPATGL
jgi:uncharacterized membrane protein HdeD (DUF308 family)